MSRGKSRKGRSKVRVGEAASLVVVQVYHTGQGQDERAEASLGRRVCLQKHEGGALLQLGKQLQGGRVVFLEAGRQLVHQARLGLDQGILIAGQCFQFLHNGAIRLQSAQLGQVKAAYLGQQMGVNLIGLGSCRFAQLIGRLGVHRIDRDPRFQQESDQQSMVGFDNTRQVFGLSRNTQHKLFQRVQPFVAVGKAPRSHAFARLIQHIDVMMGVRPIQADVPHTCVSLSEETPGGVGSFYNGCSKQRPSNHRLAQEGCQGKRDLSLPVEPCGRKSLSPAVRLEQDKPANPWSKRSEKILTYKEGTDMDHSISFQHSVSIRFTEPHSSDQLLTIQLGGQEATLSLEETDKLYLWLHQHREGDTGSSEQAVNGFFAGMAALAEVSDGVFTSRRILAYAEHYMDDAGCSACTFGTVREYLPAASEESGEQP